MRHNGGLDINLLYDIVLFFYVLPILLFIFFALYFLFYKIIWLKYKFLGVLKFIIWIKAIVCILITAEMALFNFVFGIDIETMIRGKHTSLLHKEVELSIMVHLDGLVNQPKVLPPTFSLNTSNDTNFDFPDVTLPKISFTSYIASIE